MNAYQAMLESISSGVNSFVVALMSIYYYILCAGASLNDMTAEKLSDIMTRLGYTYNTSTDTFNDGTKDYTVFELFQKVLTDYYPMSDTLNSALMYGMIKVSKLTGKITDAQKVTLLGVL